MSGADLRGAQLARAELAGTDLESADLRGADLREANWQGASLRGAWLYGAELPRELARSARSLGAVLTDRPREPPTACPEGAKSCGQQPRCVSYRDRTLGARKRQAVSSAAIDDSTM